MTTPLKTVIAVVAAAGMFAAGYLAHREPAPAASSIAGRRVLYYACPMHPQYRSDHPGDAPCCGMRLEPVYEGGTAEGQPRFRSVPGTVLVDPDRQQALAVRIEPAKREAVSQVLRVPGRVVLDDNRVYRIIAAADGWIRTLGANPAGTFVKKDEILASYYTPSFQTAQQNLLFALEGGEQLQRRDLIRPAGRPPIPSNLQVALDGVRALGMSEVQIEEIRRTRAYASDIYIYAPTSGFVAARNISPQQRIDKGTELYRIADLSHLWILTDLFEKDAPYAKPGSVATVRYQGRELRARMSDSLPQFDPQSRTLKTRFELDNPGFLLRPEMFVDVELRIERPAAITLPSDAVIDSGRRKIVFVECGPGCFAPRQVETGWSTGDRVEITGGLEPGEQVVVAGAFLIDSESRMRLASSGGQAEKGNAGAGAGARAVDPVCGMEVEKAKDAITASYRGKTYWFCSKSCKEDFEKNPQKYLAGSAAAQHSAATGPA